MSESLTIGLSETGTTIRYNNTEAEHLLHFLFSDIPLIKDQLANRCFDVNFSETTSHKTLWLGEKRYYSGSNSRELSYLLVNEVIHDCLRNRNAQYAIHAAAFDVNGKGVILPGLSGNGKSSLAAWLTFKGWTYLTDELVLLSEIGVLTGFTRPISLRNGAFQALVQHLNISEECCITSENGTMMSHRALNSNWSSKNPKLAIMIFPRFEPNKPTRLTEISPAQGCMQLIGSHVDAQILPGHGFSGLASLARTTKCYELQYARFRDLDEALKPIVNIINSET